MTHKCLVVPNKAFTFASKLRIMMNTDQNNGGEGYTYKYPHPAVTADCVVFGFDGKMLHLLLIERGLEPYKGSWALPGGFMKIDESIEECARRELSEETGVTDVFLEQFHVFSSVHRDPRERVMTVAFLALVRKSEYRLIAGDDASQARWFDVDELPPLAFDHPEIITAARKRLRELVSTRPVAFRLLDDRFTASELQRIYEAINDTSYDRRNFYRSLSSIPYVNKIGIANCKTSPRPAELFEFDEDTYCAEEEEKKRTPRSNPFNF